MYLKDVLPDDYVLDSEKDEIAKQWIAKHLIFMEKDMYEKYYHLNHDAEIPDVFYGARVDFKIVLAPGVKITGDVGHIEVIQGKM